MPSSRPTSTKAAEGGSRECFYVENDIREDDAIHERILRDVEGDTTADLAAVRDAVRDGLPFAQAVELYAGGGARMVLRRSGML